MFEDPVIAEAIVNRLEKPGQKINLTGGSYRDRFAIFAAAKFLEGIPGSVTAFSDSKYVVDGFNS